MVQRGAVGASSLVDLVVQLIRPRVVWVMVPSGEPTERTINNLAPWPDRGYGYVGPAVAGHFVKMVHNGIEYGLMEADAEGEYVVCTRR